MDGIQSARPAVWRTVDTQDRGQWKHVDLDVVLLYCGTLPHDCNIQSTS